MDERLEKVFWSWKTACKVGFGLDIQLGTGMLTLGLWGCCFGTLPTGIFRWIGPMFPGSMVLLASGLHDVAARLGSLVDYSPWNVFVIGGGPE